LKNLGHIELAIDRNEVYEYYFMRHIYNSNNWLFDNYNKTMDEVSLFSKQNAINISKAYEAWMREWTPEKHARKIAEISSWVDSGNYRAR
jgi:hypothetical protein